MSILKVARMGHPVLRARARTVDKAELKSPVFQHLVDSMIDTMYEYSGVGLAAPQVHESVRVFVAMLDPDGAESDALVFVNPEVTVKGDQTVEGWEGCLSIPDIRGRVPRAQHIAVTALDRHGKRFELELKDFPARVVQHETDHLDGVLFFDRMKVMDSLTYIEEYSRYHTRQDDAEDDD
jgi:peptide deformylase